jgi:hypothetical protein
VKNSLARLALLVWMAAILEPAGLAAPQAIASAPRASPVGADGDPGAAAGDGAEAGPEAGLGSVPGAQASPWQREVALCLAVLGEPSAAAVLRAATGAADWRERAFGFEALARRLWIHGPAGGAPAADAIGELDLHTGLRAGRRDGHPSVRAAAWRASWAAGAALEEAEGIAAAAEPLVEARCAAAALAGPEFAPSPGAASRLAGDLEPRVRLLAQRALLSWASLDAEAAQRWVEATGAASADPDAGLDELLAGFEALERLEDPRAAAALESALRQASAPEWVRLAPALLCAPQGLGGEEARALARAWPAALGRSSRLGALLSRWAHRAGPQLGRELLASAAAAADRGALDDALAALGPEAAAAGLELRGPEFLAFLERARFASLRWSDAEARGAFERLEGSADPLVECLEAAADPLPEAFLLELAERAPLETARVAFALLARRAPQRAPELSALCARIEPERALRFERELPPGRAWPDFAERWLRAGASDPTRRAELAPRLSACGGEAAARALAGWIDESRRQPVADPALGALFSALEALDPPAARARREALFSEQAPQGGPLLASLARGLLADAVGRSKVLLWLSSSAPREPRSERELWILLLERAGAREFAVRQAAIERLAAFADGLPPGRAEAALAALAAAPEPEAAQALGRALRSPAPARRSALARALRGATAERAAGLLAALGQDPDLSVRREALWSALARGDQWPLLLSWREAWPAPAPAPPGAAAEALAELRLEIELAAVARGLLPGDVLEPLLERAAERARDEFERPIDWPLPAPVRYEALLRALAALSAAPQPGGHALSARLAGLPSEVLGAAAAQAGDPDLAQVCLVLALAAGLGAQGGPDRELVDLAQRFEAQRPGRASQRLLELCRSAP